MVLPNIESMASDDQERYLKMAMKLDSNDPDILEMNEDFKLIENVCQNIEHFDRERSNLRFLYKVWGVFKSKTSTCSPSRDGLWIY